MSQRVGEPFRTPLHQKYADVLGIEEVVAHLASLRTSVAVPA